MQLNTAAFVNEEAVLNGRQRLTKRFLDLSLALLLVALAAPMMAAVAWAIWREGKGPILFRQQRVGEGGRLFTMYKFRTMIPGAEQLERGQGSVLIHKRPDDPRVTPLGRWLRRSSLDELPQLFNVVQGSMSLVGPRPELPWLVEQYEHWQYRRLAVPQGLTGLWQVNGRCHNPMHLSTELDIEYVEHYTLWLDLAILLKTPLVVVRGDGAY
jgi:lipopolysaccharide/colanic/teichoic acid biosynthesis glycosyltransferase